MVEDFWGIFNNIRPPSRLNPGSNYHLFKVGIEPTWEHAANKDGGKWNYRCVVLPVMKGCHGLFASVVLHAPSSPFPFSPCRHTLAFSLSHSLSLSLSAFIDRSRELFLLRNSGLLGLPLAENILVPAMHERPPPIIIRVQTL